MELKSNIHFHFSLLYHGFVQHTNTQQICNLSWLFHNIPSQEFIKTKSVSVTHKGKVMNGRRETMVLHEPNSSYIMCNPTGSNPEVVM